MSCWMLQVAGRCQRALCCWEWVEVALWPYGWPGYGCCMGVIARHPRFGGSPFIFHIQGPHPSPSEAWQF